MGGRQLLARLRQALWAEHLTGLPLLPHYRDGFIREIDATMHAMPLSSKEKQEAFRAKREMLGLTEVRGIYLPPELHAELKKLAKSLAQKQPSPMKKSP